MSRWLANVNTLLERLDGTVEEAIEEQRDEDVNDLDSILVKRGLAEDVVVTEASPNMEHLKLDPDLKQDRKEGNEEEKQLVSEVKDIQETTSQDDKKYNFHAEAKLILESDSDFSLEGAVDEASVELETTVKELATNDIVRNDGTVSKVEEEDFVSEEDKKNRDVTSMIPTLKERVNDKLETHTETSAAPLHHTPKRTLTTTSKISEEAFQQAIDNARKLQRESRTLRRHVVSLNKQLELAESELEAQRVELSLAGNRLETNRKKAKDSKEKQTKQHDSLLNTLTQENEKILGEIKARHQKQLENFQHKLQESDEKRMEEGGDWTKELEITIERERDLLKKLAFVEDEKSTLLIQISTLQSQYDRLQNRMDSISQTADNAMMREREAEDKLDMTLSMHARQLSQRQAREADLERTISELIASLALSNPKKSYDHAEGDTAAGASNNLQLKTQVYSLEEELENLKSQLVSERQRVIIMQHELRDMSKERTSEATLGRSKQHQFDRQIADMSLQISKLESNLREAHKSGGNVSKSGISFRDSKQLTELTEEVVRNQEKMGQATSEISALRNRLQVAVSRAEKAEKTLERSGAENEGDIENESYFAPPSGNGGVRRRRKRSETSIRSAIHLSSPRNQNTERLGKAIDTLDNFSVQTGKYLRYNPLARGGFLLYLIMLHTWTFAVLFFHTHKFGTIHGDFGAGDKLSHGPHALMQLTNPELSKKLTEAISSDEEASVQNKNGMKNSQETVEKQNVSDVVISISKEKYLSNFSLINSNISSMMEEWS